MSARIRTGFAAHEDVGAPPLVLAWVPRLARSHPMPWTTTQLAAFRTATQQRGAASEAHRTAWLTEARAQASACAARLAAEFGASRVVLFGSVARGDGGPGSDIDLLVDGIASARWFEAVARAMDLVTCGDVDLVPADKVHAHVAARVREEGKVLVG